MAESAESKREESVPEDAGREFDEMRELATTPTVGCFLSFFRCFGCFFSFFRCFGCEVPAIAHEQVPKMEVAEATSRNNKRVEDARRARVAELIELRRKSASGEEYNTARTQSMRTELDVTASETVATTKRDSTSSFSCVPDGLSAEELERIHEENRLHFQHLLVEKSDRTTVVRWLFSFLPGYGDGFFVDFEGRVEAGQWIRGGGEADIHEAIRDGQVSRLWVSKVFRSDYSLAQLQRPWVMDIANVPAGVTNLYNYVCYVRHGTLLQSGRFAFVLGRCWGDLRKAIDFEIVKDKTHGSPPFPHLLTMKIICELSVAMHKIHSRGILHRDLKAANCLLYNDIAKCENSWNTLVGDMDSPEGVVGTGFWRPPEVLLAVKNRVSNLCSNQEIWTKKVDIYSYAMTCYEVLTGCIPFEDRAANDYDDVINGERPPLPDYVDPKLQELLRRCWHTNPFKRPGFEDCSQFLSFHYEKLMREEMARSTDSLYYHLLLKHLKE